MKAALRMIRFALRILSLVSPRLAGKLALLLFSMPTRHPGVRPGERDLVDAAHRETIAVLGHRVATYRWGDGTRPVLLLHGWESRGSRYAPFVSELLARGYSPITFDAPGHGETTGRYAHILEYRAIATELQDRYGAFEAVIAHSLGALYVFHALRTGVTTKRLVTISGPAEFSYPAEMFSDQLRLSPRVRADLRRRMERFFTPEPNIWERFSPAYEPSTLQIPMLIIHDENDPVIAYAQGKMLAAAYGPPRARLVTTRGLGHHRILSAPAVVRQVIDFVVDTPAVDTPVESPTQAPPGG